MIAGPLCSSAHSLEAVFSVVGHQAENCFRVSAATTAASLDKLRGGIVSCGGPRRAKRKEEEDFEDVLDGDEEEEQAIDEVGERGGKEEKGQPAERAANWRIQEATFEERRKRCSSDDC